MQIAVPAGTNCPIDYAPDTLDVATRLENPRDNRMAPFQDSASTLPQAVCKHSPTEPLVSLFITSVCTNDDVEAQLVCWYYLFRWHYLLVFCQQISSVQIQGTQSVGRS